MAVETNWRYAGQSTPYVGIGKKQPLLWNGTPANGTNEVQTLTFGGTPTGGTFTLTFDGYTTAPISWSSTNATLVANIDAALEALPNIGAGGVTVAVGTMTNGIGTITVTFGGILAKKAVPTMSRTSSLTGTAPTLTIAETTAGVDGTFVNRAAAGALLIDTTTGTTYQNAGTQAAPNWTQI